METKLKKSQKGFTIIEVLIVLAIAGLIMAIVFFAVPQLQRNSRDNQRQSVANRTSAELTTYSGNNQGTYPFAGVLGATPSAANACTALTTVPYGCNEWLGRYITGKVNINDPSTGSPVTFNLFFPSAAGTLGAADYTQGRVLIAVGSSCQGEAGYTAATGTAASSRKFAIFMPLDRTQTFYCVDNG